MTSKTNYHILQLTLDVILTIDKRAMEQPLGEALLDENIDNDNRMEEPKTTTASDETANLVGNDDDEEEEEEEEEDECRVCRGPAEEG